jgi:long-chain fatty acid transport protein
MKRLFLFSMLALQLSMARAGGLMTNTNYHIAFDRMMARGATFDIDAVYSNPAGMVWGHEGLQLSFNWQMPTQNRDIEASIPGFLGSDFQKKYKGKASAPFVPGLFATYHKNRWAVGAMIGIVGSGGFVRYDDGVPMFCVPVMAKLAAAGAMPTAYNLDAQMKGKQYIYGFQANFAYKLTDWLSASAGIRANYYEGYYRGHVTATHKGNGLELVGLQLDCDQRGWGFCPIIGLDFHTGGLTVAARYEFRSKLNIPNTTNLLTVGQMGHTTDVKALADQLGNEATTQALAGQLGPDMSQKVGAYLPGAKTRYDMPALLSVAVGYEFMPCLRATLEYHFFDDKNAKMAGDRQKELTRGTHELLAGIEWDINKTFTVSLGGQRTDYGLSDAYQTNTSFACDSYSIGLGGAANITKRLRLNLGYFLTIYSDYTKTTENFYGTPYTGTEVYSRTNGVFGVGIDYKF